MIQTAKEIEIARGHGDLRENAEFKSAIEKRNRLQGELKQISEQLKQAKILIKLSVVASTISETFYEVENGFDNIQFKFLFNFLRK